MIHLTTGGRCVSGCVRACVYVRARAMSMQVCTISVMSCVKEAHGCV